MTVYLDIILIENLCMNYIILYATAFVMKLKIKHIRLLLSALTGGLYAVLTYMQIIKMYSTMIMKIILSFSMVYLAFAPKNIKAMLKEVISFYLVSFIFGGCAFALLYFIKPQDILMANGVYIGSYPLKIALLGGIIGFIILNIALKNIKHRVNKKALIYQAEIEIEGKKLTVKAMLDTGNLLKDPITGVPVIIVEKDKLYEIIPGRILNHTEKIIGGDWEICNEETEYRARFRVIPFSSIGKQNGMLLGFKADKIKIVTDVEEVIRKESIVCIYNGKISKNDTYSALIGLDILEGSEKNEYFANIKV